MGNLIKKFISVFAFLGHIRFTHTIVLTWGTLCILLIFFAILFWDATLFIQSLSQQSETQPTKTEITLITQDIDDAMMILNNRQQQFNALLPSTATSTVLF